MSALRSGRRQALAALGLAGAVAAPALAEPPSAVMRKAREVRELYRLEIDASDRTFAARGTSAEGAARAAETAAFNMWKEAALDLASLPSRDAQDMLAKMAIVVLPLRDGQEEAETEVAESLLFDLWRLAPEIRPLMRWRVGVDRLEILS